MVGMGKFWFVLYCVDERGGGKNWCSPVVLSCGENGE